MSVRITERFNGALAGCRVDEQAGVIHNALLCGFESLNKRRYPKAVFEKRVGRYQGAKVNFNHAQRDRQFQDWVGVVEGPTVDADGRPRGRLELFKSDPFAGKLLEAARRYPGKFGLSHVAVCRTRRENGVEVVEDIESVESVDIVTDPATTKGIFESVQRGQAMSSAAKTAATRLLESLQASATGTCKQSLRRVLVELDMTRHQNAVTVAFETAGHSIWSAFIAGELDEDSMLTKLRKLAKGHKDAGGSGDTSGTPALESRSGVRWDSHAGRLVFGDGTEPTLTDGPLGWNRDGRTLAEEITGRSSRAEAAAFIESVTGRRPKPSATWDGKRIRFTD